MTNETSVFPGRHEQWIRGLVEFYDFLFESALQTCPAHTTESMLAGFADGKEPYEDAIHAIASKWATFDDALADHRRAQ